MTFNDWYSKYDWKEERNVIDFLGSLDNQLLIEVSPITYLKENMNYHLSLFCMGIKIMLFLLLKVLNSMKNLKNITMM